MHEDSCIGINYAHMCFRSLYTVLGFALYFVSAIQLLSLYPFTHFLTCTRILCRDSHCENGSVEVLSLQPETNLTMISEVYLPQPTRQPQTTKSTVPNRPMNSMKRLDDISNHDMQLITTNLGQHLLDVQGSTDDTHYPD